MKPLTEFVSDPARCAASLVSTPSAETVVYGCVLPWNGSTWRGLPSKGGVAFEAAVTLYSGDWSRLRAAFPDALTVVAGDFNQSLAGFHYYGSKYQRDVLESALRSCGLMACTAGTFDPVARDSAPRACIDHICVSDRPNVRVAQTTRWPAAPKPDSRLSDHFGIIVELAHT
jgi:endonuclease/exonuclease/phosphatase family metal-dependent hydrolase